MVEVVTANARMIGMLLLAYSALVFAMLALIAAKQADERAKSAQAENTKLWATLYPIAAWVHRAQHTNTVRITERGES